MKAPQVKLAKARFDLNKALANQVGGWRVRLKCLKKDSEMKTKPRRKSKAQFMKEEMESIVSYLNMTDDSSHGIEIAAIENKGRGIKVRTKVSS